MVGCNGILTAFNCQVFDSEGPVVGVATAIIKDANNICYIIPLPVIQSFLRAATALLGVAVEAAEHVLLQEAVHRLAVPLPRGAALIDVVHAELLAPGAERERDALEDMLTDVSRGGFTGKQYLGCVVNTEDSETTPVLRQAKPSPGTRTGS